MKNWRSIVVAGVAVLGIGYEVDRSQDGFRVEMPTNQAGQRLYVLTASFPSVGTKRDKDVDRFLNSFVMTGVRSPAGDFGGIRPEREGPGNLFG